MTTTYPSQILVDFVNESGNVMSTHTIDNPVNHKALWRFVEEGDAKQGPYPDKTSACLYGKDPSDFIQPLWFRKEGDWWYPLPDSQGGFE